MNATEYQREYRTRPHVRERRATVEYQQQLENYHRNRAAAVELMGGRCVRCGSTRKLEFDHIDPTTKTWPFIVVFKAWSWERIVEELEKAQLLCKRCHGKKSAEFRWKE